MNPEPNSHHTCDYCRVKAIGQYIMKSMLGDAFLAYLCRNHLKEFGDSVKGEAGKKPRIITK